MIHAEVYLLAKYLDIGPLMERAIERFSAVIAKSFRADAFVEAIARVYNHGHDGGNGLRARILSLCIDNSELIKQDGKLARLLEEHEPIAWKLLLRRDAEHACEWDETVRVQLDLQMTLEVLQVTTKSLRHREVDLIEDRDRMIALLEKHDKCRNCDKEFGSYVDRDERGILRFKTCRCRYYPER